MAKFKSLTEFQSKFHITHRGVKYTKEDLENIYKNLEETTWEFKEFDPFNLSDEARIDIETIKIKLKASAWKSRQRSLRKKGKLDQYKIDSLNKLGMVWNPREDEWEKMYLMFRKRGFCYDLEPWIKEQRQLYNSEQIQIENLIRLQAINFPFKKEENELFPFTYECYRNLDTIFFDNSSKVWEKEKSTIAWKKNSNEAIIENTIRLKIDQIRSSFSRDLYKLSYQESISLIDRLIEGENIFGDDFVIAKYTQKIIDKKGLKGKFGNPKYYDTVLSTEKSDDSIFYKIFKYFNPKDNEKLSELNIYASLGSFNKNRIKPMVRKYCCEKMIDFFEVIGKEKMRNFAPLDYLISYHQDEKNINELQKLKKYIEKYPLLNILYKDKIE
jgi:hypothetical protein